MVSFAPVVMAHEPAAPGGTEAVITVEFQTASSPILALVSAMASLGAPAASGAYAGEPWVARGSTLAAPRIQVA